MVIMKNDTTESNPRQMTSGAVPQLSLNATAVVKHNKMFVLGGRDRNASADRDVDSHMEKGPSTYDFRKCKGLSLKDTIKGRFVKLVEQEGGGQKTKTLANIIIGWSPRSARCTCWTSRSGPGRDSPRAASRRCKIASAPALRGSTREKSTCTGATQGRYFGLSWRELPL